MNIVLEFDADNQLIKSSEEGLEFIDNESKVTIIFEKGFEKDSDTEDVFRGLVGDIAFEENPEFIDAMEFQGEIQHTFFISNDKVETPFNERGSAKRLVEDGFWTKIYLHDHPLKNGCFAVIKNNKENNEIAVNE